MSLVCLFFVIIITYYIYYTNSRTYIGIFYNIFTPIGY